LNHSIVPKGAASVSASFMLENAAGNGDTRAAPIRPKWLQQLFRRYIAAEHVCVAPDGDPGTTLRCNECRGALIKSD
jgi:hypothetical protein